MGTIEERLDPLNLSLDGRASIIIAKDAALGRDGFAASLV